jgi:hypothetical protein
MERREEERRGGRNCTPTWLLDRYNDIRPLLHRYNNQ